MRYAGAACPGQCDKPREEVNVPRANLRDATIVFDLDGTLVDTAPDLTNALNDALTRRGYAAISQETIRSAVGFGARVMIEEALRRAGAAEDIDEMLAEFLAHYEANIAAESRPFPGAVASLEALAASRARLAICTNKREYLTRKLLEALGLQHYFQGIAGRDTFAVSKPDPGHLTGVIAQAGGEPSRSVMVGDSDVDIRTAKDASVPSILVSFGYAREALGELVPDAVISHFDELVPSARPSSALRRGYAGAASPRPPTPQICPISTGLLSTWSHSQKPLSPAFRSFRLHAFPRERKRC
jgi:phosphoglycolate phosphatase